MDDDERNELPARLVLELLQAISSLERESQVVTSRRSRWQRYVGSIGEFLQTTPQRMDLRTMEPGSMNEPLIAMPDLEVDFPHESSSLLQPQCDYDVSFPNAADSGRNRLKAPLGGAPNDESHATPAAPRASEQGYWRAFSDFVSDHRKTFLLFGMVGALMVLLVEDGHEYKSGPAVDPAVSRFVRILSCAYARSPSLDQSDYGSPEYKALELLQEQSDVQLPGLTPCPPWDSTFGQGFAMILLHIYLDGTGWDIDRGVSSICSWKRALCDKHGRIVQLSFNNANITGYLPTAVGALVHLEHLLFNTNPPFAGTLPSEFGTLSRLQSLNMQQTRVSGEVPSQLGRLTALKQLILYDTDLYGVIPPEICGLVSKGSLDDLLVSCNSSLRCTCCTRCRDVDTM